MKVRIHAKGLDKTFRLAMYGMIEYSMVKLIPSKRPERTLRLMFMFVNTLSLVKAYH